MMGIYIALGLIYVFFGGLCAWAIEEDIGRTLEHEFGKDVKEGIIGLTFLFWPVVVGCLMAYVGLFLLRAVALGTLTSVCAVGKLVLAGVRLAFRGLVKCGEAIVNIFAD
ncbi:hypothetical protein Roomu2_00131 [Pseudomonas phage vB_PpuM-Roomu-2]|uniref:Uncharacterized protein n=1 Tax=Pseudomonas phage vB_PpuM-Roomu-2 TaxID=3132621 RepID=A0AAX4MYF0_9CAUD